MPIYEFEAVDPGDNTVGVRVAAADVHEALRKVEQRGYFMASLAESEAAGNGHAGRRKRRASPSGSGKDRSSSVRPPSTAFSKQE